MDEQNYLDMESISTPQTVYSSNHVNMQHKRVAEPTELPRRMNNAWNAPERALSPTSIRQRQLRAHLLQLADSNGEITESRQMLFDKHMGHVDDDNDNSIKSLQRFNVCGEQSDDGISSTYPNSSRSTIRDLTCSSISSAMARSSSFVCEDSMNLWAENENKMIQSITAPNKQRLAHRASHPAHPDMIAENPFELPLKANKHRSSPRNHFDITTKFQRGKSVESTEQITRDAFASHGLIQGYTREHLLRAEKFGSVIKVIRKPGHHIGPTRNPDCECAHCRRWFDERRNFRERAASFDVINSIAQTPSNSNDRSKFRFNTNVV